MATLILWNQVLQNIKKALRLEKLLKSNEEENLNRWDNDIIQKCKILYCQNPKSMAETCMCWGLECGEGWKQPLRKLSYILEALNLHYYPKYNIRIQADQVKEKFGTLRFYHSVVIEPRMFIKIIVSFLNIFIKQLRKIKYGVSYTPDSKYVAANHRFLYKILKFLQSCTYTLTSLPINYSEKQKVISTSLDYITHDLIRKAEKECEDHCETCGNYIGENSYHTKCETVGWIKYICEVCAEKSERRYTMNGALYQGTTCIKTKEEIAKEQEQLYIK